VSDRLRPDAGVSSSDEFLRPVRFDDEVPVPFKEAGEAGDEVDVACFFRPLLDFSFFIDFLLGGFELKDPVGE
jgi:hypothetical protein